MATEDNATKTYLAHPDNQLQESTEILQRILANSIFMYSLYKKYHWHVAGEDFYSYHLLFDKHAAEQLPIIDAVAERLRTIGSSAPGMPSDVVTLKTVEESSDPVHDAAHMLQNLLDIHERYISAVREGIKVADASGDAGTSDMLTSEVLRVHELELWFIRSCKQ